MISKTVRAVATTVISAALCFSSLVCAAPATTPDALSRLPQMAIGVVGSGDAMELKVAEGQTVRSLAIGGVFADAWILQSLSPSEASFVRGAEVRRIGLNPSGAIIVAEEQGRPDIVVFNAELERRTAQERAAINQYHAELGKRNPAFLAQFPGVFNLDEYRQWFGDEAYQAFLENDRRLGVLRKEKARADALAAGDFNKVRYYDKQPVAGPDSFIVIDLANPDASAIAAGLTSRFGYSYVSGYASAVQRGEPVRMVKCFTPLAETTGAFCP